MNMFYILNAFSSQETRKETNTNIYGIQKHHCNQNTDGPNSISNQYCLSFNSNQ